MNININGMDYEVRFGVGFTRAIDEKYPLGNGADSHFGLGLENTIPYLLTFSITVLAEFLYLGTVHLKKRPTQSMIDAYIDKCEDIDGLFAEVMDELKKSNATRLKVNRLVTLFEKEKESE